MKKPKHYYCHRTNDNFSEIPKGYQLIDKIGEGTFGQVYKVFNTSASTIEVMKKNKGDLSISLAKQSEIMSTMNSSDGFAKLKDASSNDGFLIMTLLGDNIENIIDKSSLNIVDVKRIAYQCILRLKQLHERGYVHRDLKPDNVLLGNQNNPHKVYLVDFGLSSTFKKTATTARKCYSGEIGTIKFCPLASHYCIEQFPKDDMQSLGYLLVYIATKKLPWSYLDKNLAEKQKFDEIKKRKQSTQTDQLCQGLSCLRKYMTLVRSYKIGEAVDYSKLLQLFFIPCQQQYCYSFCRKQCFAKLRKIYSQEEDEAKEQQDQQDRQHKFPKEIKYAKKK